MFDQLMLLHLKASMCALMRIAQVAFQQGIVVAAPFTPARKADVDKHMSGWNAGALAELCTYSGGGVN